MLEVVVVMKVTRRSRCLLCDHPVDCAILCFEVGSVSCAELQLRNKPSEWQPQVALDLVPAQ